MVDTPSPPPVCYISVDVESSGPSPTDYSMLAIGACRVTDPTQRFYVELQPDREGVLDEAMAVSGLSLERLARDGKPVGEAMAAFAGWLAEVVPEGERPLMVALNAPFDWMFVCDYFHRTLGYNPFGHSALDMKALYVGLTGAPWGKSGLRAIADYFGIDQTLTHHALEDALFQALLCRRLLDALGESNA